MKLTIAYLTSRESSKIEWFFDSLAKQLSYGDEIHFIVVDGLLNDERMRDFQSKFNVSVPKDVTATYRHVLPKPTIWQGKHRITKVDWWAKSNAHNTAIILCETDFIAFLDDRSILTSEWLNCVKEAMTSTYAVCGSYEKRSGMIVERGEIKFLGECLGVDIRSQFGKPVPTSDWYGGSCALPLEWCLAVNGYSEDLCDGLGSEDSMFGRTMIHSGFPMKFDSRMRIIEDRTPGPAYEGALKRADKRVDLGRRAKSWGIVKAFHLKTSSQNSFDIRHHRARVRNGEDLQSIMPSASHFDWYDGQPVSEME